MSRIPKQCKRLAEVDFPIAVVSKHSPREKSIRHGHPSTLHLWWARRPLAACRAMLMALLLPDPADENCPPEFIVEARKILLAHPGASDRLRNEVARHHIHRQRCGRTSAPRLLPAQGRNRRIQGDGADIPDATRLTAVVLGPTYEWSEPGSIRSEIAEWTTSKGKSPRLYPGALLWVVKKAGRELFDKVEAWLAWQRVERDVRDGSLGEIDKADRNEVAGEMKGAEEDARDEVWASYRFVVFKDGSQPDGLQVIDLGAGHASSSESLTGRIITALRTSSLLNESPGSAYLERRWPPAFKDPGAWPVASLRQAFLSGGMERLLERPLEIQLLIS